MPIVIDDVEEEEMGEQNEPCTCNGSGCDQEVLAEDPYYATPCGTYCSDCMEKHIAVCEVCKSEFADDFDIDEGNLREAQACNGEKCRALVRPDDPYYATPCGTFCSPCMRQHRKVCECCQREFDN